MSQDVSRLRRLNKDLIEDCVIEVADNSRLKGEFRMAMDIVEGYVIDVFKPWCHQYGRSEPVFYSQMREKQSLMNDSRLANDKTV